MARKHAIETIMFLTYAAFAMSWVAGSMMTPAIMAHYGVETLTSATWVTTPSQSPRLSATFWPHG